MNKNSKTAAQIDQIDREATKNEIVKLMIEVQRTQKQYLQLYKQGATIEDSEVLSAFTHLYTALQEEQNEQLSLMIAEEVGLNTED